MEWLEKKDPGDTTGRAFHKLGGGLEKTRSGRRCPNMRGDGKCGRVQKKTGLKTTGGVEKNGRGEGWKKCRRRVEKNDRKKRWEG